ncbi:hypothetical protein D1BOALGB6SA_6469 [Olavius sp. associated proteobacterium Delta 1]|nr:hypothetical protein D1BOALGB6SA_6469 [Olavius sp. associated proteobacterium Delta 1]
MEDFGGSKSFTSFKELGGITVGVDDVINEISKLPLDGVLGFLGGLSLEMIQETEDFFSPRLQGGYLQNAIVDDFPRKIPNAFKMYIPGRVPITGGRHIFVHEQNLAWLCNAAILNSKENQTTSEISHDFRCRMFRILLIINDFLSAEGTEKPYNLDKRRIFSLNWLRHGQFNRLFGKSVEILVKLARQKILLLDILPKYYDGVEDAFNKATGISLSSYFYAICIFVTHLYEGMNKGTHWLEESTITSNIRNNEKDIKKVISNWKRSPSQYRDAYNLWMENRQGLEKLPIYDFVPLRETPLIEGRPRELVCPVPPFLFSKIEDGPFYILSDFLSGPELNRFHVALGNAYEEYANQLIERIAIKDTRGVWNISSKPQSKKKGELTDCYLQRINSAIVFEHKGQRPGTEFLRGGQSDRVLGPTKNLLERLENGESIDYIEGSKYDKGFISRGMWQQSKKGSDIIAWATSKFGDKPIHMYPVITLLSSLVVDAIVRKAYLNPLIDDAKLYVEDFWEKPQWINIADLESLSQIAEDGKLDIEALLSEKDSNSVNDRFDMFLSSKKLRIINIRVHSEMLELLDQSSLYFFGKKLKRRSEKATV